MIQDCSVVIMLEIQQNNGESILVLTWSSNDHLIYIYMCVYSILLHFTS